MVPVVFQVLLPLRFLPRNRAPGVGPVAPPNQVAPSFSGDHWPIRVTSVTIAQTRSAGESTSSVTRTSSAISRRRRLLTGSPVQCDISGLLVPGSERCARVERTDAPTATGAAGVRRNGSPRRRRPGPRERTSGTGLGEGVVRVVTPGAVAERPRLGQDRGYEGPLVEVAVWNTRLRTRSEP